MSAIEPPERNENGTLEELPQFDYDYLYDDEDDPSEVTIFADEVEELSTNWITIDERHAVPLEKLP